LKKFKRFSLSFRSSNIIRIKRVYTFKRARERDAQILYIIYTHTHTHVPVYIDFTNPHALEEETEESKERESEY